MATNTNFNRIYWAITAFGVAKRGSGHGGTTQQQADATQYGLPDNAVYMRGIQSVGITTNFNLEQVFQLGQLSIYEDVEEVPDVEVSIERVLDGRVFHDHIQAASGKDASSPPAVDAMHCHLLYGHVTQLHASSIPTMQNEMCDIYLSLNRDSDSNAGDGLPDAYVYCSGMYISNASWTFATDGNLTESISLVGNHKVWTTGSHTTGVETDAIGPDESGRITPDDIGSNALASRINWSVLKVGDVDDEVEGSNDPSDDGANLAMPSGSLEIIPADVLRRENVHFVNKPSIFDAETQITSCSISVDFGREQINVLGSRLPYYRYVSYPVEVSTEWEILARGDEGLNAYPERNNVTTSDTIRVQTKNDDGVVCADWYLGAQNKCTSVSYGGGTTGGENVTYTYSYRNFNDLIISTTGALVAGSVGGIGPV
tara:strand:- start:1449 stop:2732 length:1284 start_codon:yes stop_codon:yes gene_type:complete